MDKQYTEIIVLCEDTQQAYFIRHYLIERGYHRRKIREEFAPSGRGAGEQFVRQSYANQVRSYRREVNRKSVALIIMIDADTHSALARLREFAQILKDNSLSERRDDERIAIFVPKRNIETWIYYARIYYARIYYTRGVPIDEEPPYPKLSSEGECLNDIRTFVKSICQKKLPETAPDSLRHACEELKRIL